jgi:hypothetical protein
MLTQMPQFQWSTEPTDLIRPFEVRHNAPEAGALFAWASRAVEELFYLDDIDLAFEASAQTIGNHNPDVVDVAHARWATGTCITALDLCAAAFGRTFCGNTSNREMDMVDFDNTGRYKKNAAQRRKQLPTTVLTWIDGVLTDADYMQTKSARNWLTHSRVTRHFKLGPSGRHRLRLSIDGHEIPVRQVIENARGVAVRHIPAVLKILPTI